VACEGNQTIRSSGKNLLLLSERENIDRMHSRDRWNEIEDIFFSAVELEPVARQDYLRKVCGNDEALYSEITALLEERKTSSVLSTPVFNLGMQLLNEEVSGDKRSGTSLGRFQIGELIGRGGMADVYRAVDVETGQTVALKVLSESFAIDRERVRRFRREATAIARISDPNVAQVYGFHTDGGENFIAMELVEGVNLRQVMTERLEVKDAIEIAIQVTSALASAHAAGVVHRDIKPENIIIKSDGVVKVLDFGLAKLNGPISETDEGSIVRHTPTLGMSTEHGMLIGTPAYMSPEQIRGAETDLRTDIWSVGVVLFEMVSGRPPFSGQTKIDTIAAILLSEPRQLDLSKGSYFQQLSVLLQKALAKDKIDRYSNAPELLTDLRDLKHIDRSVPSPLGAVAYLPYLAVILIALLLIVAIASSRRS
jgi:eukaryotic-like serine/threonine-protein kinase